MKPPPPPRPQTIFTLGLALVAVSFGARPPLAAAGAEGAAQAPADPDPTTAALSAATGEELVRQLVEPATRSRAFFELWRRADPKSEGVSYEAFVEKHYDPEVVVCPQPDGKPPIYIVLYGFLSRRPSPLRDGYAIERPNELFPPLPREPSERGWTEPAIDAYAADGSRLAPFDGNNVLSQPGVLADINGDGFVERADHTNYQGGATVAYIQAVEKTARPLLAVLYNWGADEWSYRLTDRDGDGVFDLELGPGSDGAIDTKVAYRWDPDTRTYKGPAGGEGDHFRVIDGSRDWDEIKRLRKEGLRFPAEPKNELAVAAPSRTPRERGPWSRLGVKTPGPTEVSQPYRRRPLGDLSHGEIARYMGAGKNYSQLAWDAAIKTHLPEGFWDSDPKAAALALAETNRYPDHRRLYRLAVDDRDGRAPPAVCTASFSYASARCYTAVDTHYVIRADPDDSYFAYAGTQEGGIVFYNLVHNRPTHDLRRFALPYADARHLVHAIWWLDRVRSRAEGRADASSRSFSTADGKIVLALRDAAGNARVEIREREWSGSLPDIWTGEYTREVCANLAAFLFRRALTERLGDAWSKLEPDPRQLPGNAPETEEIEREKTRRVGELARRFLESFTPDQSRLSYAIAAEAAKAAGDLGLTGLAPRLEAILAALPPREKPGRSYEEVSREQRELFKNVKDPDRMHRRYQELSAELKEILNAGGPDRVGPLRDAITLSLEKLRMADDVDALRHWSRSGGRPGWQWALQRLKEINPEAYVDALAWWLENTEENWARQVFDEIARVDPGRAGEIAKSVPAFQKNDLSVSAFTQLDRIGEIPDEAERVDALIRLALDPAAGWQERGRAIDALVPPEQPLRYPEAEIDAALLKVLEPEFADEGLNNFTFGNAYQAIARRGRTEHFDHLAERLDGSVPGIIYGRALGALAHLAQFDPAALSPRLAEFVRPHFEQTNLVTDVLWAVWAADLQVLRPELERLATSGPDDYEGEQANQYGGNPRPPEGRFHLARKILALWDEEDAATRAKLLVAFALADAYRLVSRDVLPERRERVRAALAEVKTVLPARGLAEVRAFVEWCEEHPPEIVSHTARKYEVQLAAFVRESLGI